MKTQVRSSEAGGRTKPRRFEPRKKGAKASHGIDPQEKTESRPPPCAELPASAFRPFIQEMRRNPCKMCVFGKFYRDIFRGRGEILPFPFKKIVRNARFPWQTICSAAILAKILSFPRLKMRVYSGASDFVLRFFMLSLSLSLTFSFSFFGVDFFHAFASFFVFFVFCFRIGLVFSLFAFSRRRRFARIAPKRAKPPTKTKKRAKMC